MQGFRFKELICGTAVVVGLCAFDKLLLQALVVGNFFQVIVSDVSGDFVQQRLNGFSRINNASFVPKGDKNIGGDFFCDRFLSDNLAGKKIDGWMVKPIYFFQAVRISFFETA